jgi:hypothetical protein
MGRFFMDWNVIPEIFYDIIARIIPGSVLVIATTMIYLGPSKVVKMLLSDSTEIDAPLTLLFLLLAYLVAIVTGSVWEAVSCLAKRWGECNLAKRWKDWIKRRREKKKSKEIEAATSKPIKVEKAQDVPFDTDRTFFRVRKDLPQEASKLLKIQAEKRLCEVLIVGFSVLWPVDLCLCVFGSPPYQGEQAFLLGAIALSIFSCWEWRIHLENQYLDSLGMLQDILDEQERKKADAAAKAKK